MAVRQSRLVRKKIKIYMAMHISRSNPIGDQKFDNLKIWKSKIVDRAWLS